MHSALKRLYRYSSVLDEADDVNVVREAVPNFTTQPWPIHLIPKMAAILVLFCFLANWPLWPRFQT